MGVDQYYDGGGELGCVVGFFDSSIAGFVAPMSLLVVASLSPLVVAAKTLLVGSAWSPLSVAV